LENFILATPLNIFQANACEYYNEYLGSIKFWKILY